MQNVIGKTFGELRVVAPAERKGYVTCQCRCGRIKDIRLGSLTKVDAPTRSCGCIQRKIASRIGSETVRRNAARQIRTNKQYNTNFQVIEREKPPKNNTSGVKGVSWNSDRGKWEAYISVHGKRIGLGKYNEFNEAVNARKTAENTYFKPLIEAKQQGEML